MAEYSIPNGAAGGNTAGDAHWKAPVANYASLPASGNSNGDTRVALDTSDQWTWNGSAWVSPTAGAIALTNSQIFVGNASNVATSVAMSGDVTISNTGVTTIGASKVTEAMQVLADNTTNDVSITKHGYAPKAPNDATKYLDGTGAWSVPAGGGGGLPAPIVGTSAGNVALTGSNQSVGTVALPAPDAGTDHYLITYFVSDNLYSVSATGGANRQSFYTVEDSTGQIAAGTIAGAMIYQTLVAPLIGNTKFNSSLTFRYDCTQAETITVYGIVPLSFTGTWFCEGGAQIIAQKVGNTPVR